MERVIEHEEGQVRLENGSRSRIRVEVIPRSPDYYVQGSPLETDYPPELIELILQQKSPAYLCDEIAREEDPLYARLVLEAGVFSYLAPEAFAGKRILDFGCGAGASTCILARLLPDTEIVGVELSPDTLVIARARTEHYGFSNVSFHQSPSGERLPDGIGSFDFIVLNAVYEHLLPDERKVIMKLLWRVLNPHGVLFMQETPNGLFPLELHTTGLPLLNYVPDRLAHLMARKFSSRVEDKATWGELLRAGIRGGTVGEILSNLPGGSSDPPRVLQPRLLGRQDQTDLWYDCSLVRHGEGGKRKLARRVFKICKGVTGKDLTPELSLALQKG
jgi:2-polyprenyl-3-methyl-5-hydroxy-6-metoxy-1,4-benzoquinol methylase